MHGVESGVKPPPDEMTMNTLASMIFWHVVWYVFGSAGSHWISW